MKMAFIYEGGQAAQKAVNMDQRSIQELTQAKYQRKEHDIVHWHHINKSWPGHFPVVNAHST